jgi:hypothetical protein
MYRLTLGILSGPVVCTAHRFHSGILATLGLTTNTAPQGTPKVGGIALGTLDHSLAA